MKKYLFSALLLTFAPQYSRAALDNTRDNAFEAELRLLEAKDEATFNRAEQITNQESASAQNDDFVYDAVGVKNSATERPITNPEILVPVKSEKQASNRRIRSR